MAEYLVSVVIPVHNAARYLVQAVDSVVTLPEAGEVILVDDGSTDQSLTICIELAKKYNTVRWMHHPDKKNHGVASTRNLGINAARFDYIAFLDADDYYLPNRFKKEKEMFLSCSDIDGVYGCNQAVFESEGAKVKFLSQHKQEQTTLSKAIPPQDLFRALILGGNGRFHTSAITLRKRAFQKAGFFNIALRMTEDTELWLKLSLKSVLVPGSIDNPIAIRRVHDTNSIHNLEEVQNYKRRMYQILFDWSIGQAFQFEVKNCFFVTLHKFGIGEAYNVRKLFWKQVARNPRMIVSTFFYKKIHQLYFT